jgi:hypothetical protein
MTSAARSLSACSRALFLATEGSELNEAARNILHFTEPSFVLLDETFKFRDATSRSWDIRLSFYRVGACLSRTSVTEQVTPIANIAVFIPERSSEL